MLNEANVLNLIQDWVSRGLVAPEHQATLVTDVRRLQHGVTAPAVAVKTTPARRINPLVVTIAVICGLLGLALLAQLAANWQDIPRLVRVVVLCCSLVLLYGGAEWRRRKVRAEDAVMHGLACLGTVVYGVALLLVSQMFHIGGTVAQWLLLWMGGAFLTALAFSSRPVLILTTILAGFWGGCLIFPQGTDKSLAPLTDYIWQYPAVLLVLFLPARRWHCTTARVLLFLLAGLWGMTVLGQVIVTWSDLSKGLRLILLLLVLLALYGRMGWSLRKGAADAAKAQTFAVFGNLFYGLTLVLVGQMFSLGGTVPDWLLLWWLGTFAMTLVLSSRPLLFFTLVLIGCLGQHLWIVRHADVYTVLFAVTLVLFCVAAWRLRHRDHAAPADTQGIVASLLYGGVLLGGCLQGLSPQGVFWVWNGEDAVALGWLLPWVVGSYLIALLTLSRVTLGVTILLTALWGRFLIFQGGDFQPFTEYAGQWIPALLLLLLPALRWKSPATLLLWQILLLGWLDILLWYGGSLDPVPVRIGAVILLHLAVAMVLYGLPSRWDGLKRGCVRLNLWVAVGLTFAYALANSASEGRTLARAGTDTDSSLILMLMMSICVVAVACGLVFLRWRQRLSRLTVALWGLPLFFVVMLLSYPLLQPTVPAGIYTWLTALLVLGLLIVLLLGEAVKNRKSTMILCSLLLIATCITLYVAWSFSSSALLFLLVGASLLMGMKMVRRARG